jgi:hypothetical protein
MMNRAWNAFGNDLKWGEGWDRNSLREIGERDGIEIH